MPAAALITLSSLPWVLWHRFTSPPAPPAELASIKMVGINPVSPGNMHTQTANASTTGGTGSSADISIVCMGDSHSRHDAIEVPFADVLLHSGDFSMFGKRSHIVSFNEWLGKLPHRHKVVVAGNHDSGRDVARAGGSLMSELKGLLTNAIYLCDEFVDLPVGLDNRLLRVYASPWQPQFRGFNSYRTEAWHGMILERTVPKDRSVHVVLTHSPPWSILDEDEYVMSDGKKNKKKRWVQGIACSRQGPAPALALLWPHPRVGGQNVARGRGGREQGCPSREVGVGNGQNAICERCVGERRDRRG